MSEHNRIERLRMIVLQSIDNIRLLSCRAGVDRSRQLAAGRSIRSLRKNVVHGHTILVRFLALCNRIYFWSCLAFSCFKV